MSEGYAKLRQCSLGELRWVATGSRPDTCARLARIASRINAPCGSDLFCVNELGKVGTDWQQAAVPKYASPSDPWKALGRSDKVEKDLRKMGERMLLMGASRRKESADWDI